MHYDNADIERLWAALFEVSSTRHLQQDELWTETDEEGYQVLQREADELWRELMRDLAPSLAEFEAEKKAWLEQF